jgi:hypothetical protein
MSHGIPCCAKSFALRVHTHQRSAESIFSQNVPRFLRKARKCSNGNCKGFGSVKVLRWKCHLSMRCIKSLFYTTSHLFLSRWNVAMFNFRCLPPARHAYKEKVCYNLPNSVVEPTMTYRTINTEKTMHVHPARMTNTVPLPYCKVTSKERQRWKLFLSYYNK